MECRKSRDHLAKRFGAVSIAATTLVLFLARGAAADAAPASPLSSAPQESVSVQEASQAESSAAPDSPGAASPPPAPDADREAPNASPPTESASANTKQPAPDSLPTALPGATTEKVQLDFVGEEWLPVLEWLASARKLNLDWQKLPEGTLNLSSTKTYSIEEAEDLINMQLLARGFTLLQRGEVLRVAPLENLDITLVPKVDPEELAALPRHRFVRVTFPLEWMIAEEAAVEFKPLISPHGRLYPIASSNRLEAMDAVVNLRELYRLLTRSEADETRRERVAEFRLQHRKADEIAAKVRQLLGLPAEPVPAATNTQLDIEQARFRSEAVKQLGNNAQKLLEDKPEVYLVVNDKENSILVNGRPDKIEIVRQAIEAMDKPIPPGESSWESVNRVKIYEVSGFEPTAVSQLMTALQDRGNLSKDTRIQHDPTYNRLIVVASPEDHVTIASVVESFRVQGRRAEVLHLARIDTKYATKAVQLVLKNPSRSGTASPPGDGQFLIEPDPANKRLLLWATPAEVAEVREFLTRLGETFAPATAGSQMHVVHLRGAETKEVVQRLRQAWAEVSDVPLLIEGESSAPPSAAPADSPAPDAAPEASTDRSASRPTAQFVAQRQAADTPPSEAGAEELAAAGVGPSPSAPPSPAAAGQSPAPPPAVAPQAPVRIVADDDGELMIFSRDPGAAEAARQLVEEIVPDSDEIKIIPLEHAQATFVKSQLDALLRHTRSTGNSAFDTAEPLLIESDSRTNRLMIQHATPRQMDLIEEMIPLLDQPEQEDKQLVREQEIYKCKRKPAAEIAEIVKEVYRDLLGSSDKVFTGLQGYTFGYNRAMAATAKSPEYQGLLAIGVDDDDNTLVLSAPAYLMDEVMRVVELIDTSAAEKTVVVAPLKAPSAKANIQEALTRLLAKPQ